MKRLPLGPGLSWPQYMTKATRVVCGKGAAVAFLKIYIVITIKTMPQKRALAALPRTGEKHSWELPGHLLELLSQRTLYISHGLSF